MRLYGASRVSKAGRYLDRDLWTADFSIHRFPARVVIRLLRVLVGVGRAPFDGQLNLEATALVYRTLPSIVPLLAVAFSVLKAFGAQYRIEPLLVQMLSPLGPGGAEVARRIVEFVSNLGVSVLGAVGLIGLFYTVVSVIDERLDYVRADERKVRQVVLNLLSNAIKFTPEGGRIDVHAKPVNGSVEISVSGTGVGIAPEDQEAIFEEFRQVGTADKKVEGSGLGLALSRKFIELHGGRILVESQVGVGSTFTFTIPIRIGT